MYAQFLGTSATIDALFARLHSKLVREVEVGRELLCLQGALDLLMAASSTSAGETAAAAATHAEA